MKETAPPKSIKWVICKGCRKLRKRWRAHECTPYVLSAKEIEIGLQIAEKYGLLVPPTGVEPA